MHRSTALLLALALSLVWVVAPALGQDIPEPKAVASRVYLNEAAETSIVAYVYVLGTPEESGRYYGYLNSTLDIVAPGAGVIRRSVPRLLDGASGWMVSPGADGGEPEDAGVVLVRDRHYVFVLMVLNPQREADRDLDQAVELAEAMFASPREPERRIRRVDHEPLTEFPGLAPLDLLPTFEEIPPGFVLVDESVGIPSPETSNANAPASSASPSPRPSATFSVISYDIYYSPDELTIPADTDVLLSLPNEGAAPHNFSIDALGISVDQAPNESYETTINAAPGEYEYYCNVPGHKQAGMVGVLTAR